ncbi:hypothetical protein KFL_007560010 [Klebsormidium nitens]|uniref:ARM repeat superfamily protein n=1 Tax=Klebsormidium nitens TaxID=105231 RepID=A0A1Y1IKQ2_KLENI|nr:hypothetical protein KFL_007560010 [Klebsormidium nitens]|eukprot:GAQ91273.1 hypothetical protein KFL_007560010 [Klebsormidium nitens]
MATVVERAQAATGSQQKAPRPLSADEIPGAVEKEVQKLQSDDVGTASLAALAIFLLGQREDAWPHLHTAIRPLVNLLTSDQESIQRNVFAALTVISNANDDLRGQVAASSAVVPACLDALSDPVLGVNAANLLGALAQHASVSSDLFAVGGIPRLLAAFEVPQQPVLWEAVVDVLCHLAAEESLRPSLAQEGVIGGLVPLLACSESEVVVRALLGLGMLCGADADRQARLAEEDGAATQLLTLMKSPDEDVRNISKEVFLSLASNPILKPAIEAEIRRSTSKSTER